MTIVPPDWSRRLPYAVVPMTVRRAVVHRFTQRQLYLRTQIPVAGPEEAHLAPSAAPALQISAAKVSPSAQLTTVSAVTTRNAGA